MRVCFMGTPEFSCRILEALTEEHQVVAVLSAPDAVRGRGRTLQASPVKKCAQAYGIPCLEAKQISPELIRQISTAAPDVICVAAFGALLPEKLLELPAFGSFNVHASLLPRWRGAAPLERAILAGDPTTGVSIMRMVRELDAGPYCRQASLSIGEKTADELRSELSDLGARELLAALRDAESGALEWQPQESYGVTYAPKLSKHEMYLAPAWTAEECVRHVRASSEGFPARLQVGDTTLRICQAREYHLRQADEHIGLLPPCGSVAVAERRLLFGCSEGFFEALTVQPQGKRVMDAEGWARGYRGKLIWKEL